MQQLARHRNQPTFALGFVDLKTEASKVVRPKVPTDARDDGTGGRAGVRLGFEMEAVGLAEPRITQGHWNLTTPRKTGRQLR